MGKVTVYLVVGSYDKSEAAKNALAALRSAAKRKLFYFKESALVSRDLNGKIRVKEPGDAEGREGAAAGGIIGAVIGLIGGPAGAMVGGAAGALVGGLAAEIIDAGIDDNRLEDIGQALLPGGSAVVVVVESGWHDAIERFLLGQGAEVMIQPLNDLDQPAAATG